MPSLEDRVERLEAESQIRQLIARYCFCLLYTSFIGGLATGTTATRIIAETFRSSRGAALGIVLSGIGLRCV